MRQTLHRSQVEQVWDSSPSSLNFVPQRASGGCAARESVPWGGGSQLSHCASMTPKLPMKTILKIKLKCEPGPCFSPWDLVNGRFWVTGSLRFRISNEYASAVCTVFPGASPRAARGQCISVLLLYHYCYSCSTCWLSACRVSGTVLGPGERDESDMNSLFYKLTVWPGDIRRSPKQL